MIKKIIKFLKFHLFQKPKIPRGDYCYKIIKIEHSKLTSLPPKIFVKTCPYWEKVNEVEWGWSGHCKLLNISGLLIEQQCKECGIKIGDKKHE